MRCFALVRGLVLGAVFVSLAACHHGGGRSSGNSDSPGGDDPTEQEEEEEEETPKEEDKPVPEEEQEEADKDPGNVNVPPVVVPPTYQGKRLYYVEINVNATAYSALGTSQTVFSFKLKQGGSITDGYASFTSATGDPEYHTYSGGSWSGWAPTADMKEINVLTITAPDATGQEFTFQAENIPLSGKSIQGSRTVYTGTITCGRCSLGNGTILELQDMSTEMTLIYYTAPAK